MSQNNKNKVFMMSSAHTYNDGRIMYREAASLQKNHEVELHICAPFDEKEIQGVKVYGLPMWNSPKDRLKTIWILIQRIIKSNASAFHFHDPELLILVPLIKLIKRKKVIYDVHESYPNSIMDKDWIPKFLRYIIKLSFIFVERVMLSCIDAVIYTTDPVGERYNKIRKLNSVRINNVPLNDIFKNKPSFYNDRENAIIFLGVIVSQRGVLELIQAFNEFRKTYSEYKLKFVGRIFYTKFRNQVEFLIKKNNLNDKVYLLDPIPYKDIANELSNCKIGVVTYLPLGNNMACLPNKMFEYMAAGLPIIASNFAGYRKVIEPETCGICVDPTNINEITEAMKLIAGNPNKAEEMSQNSRNAYLKKYNWQKEEQKLLDLYTEIIPNIR